MDRAAAEDLVGRRTKLLVLVAGAVGSALSVLYILAFIMPLLYFHGYVRGYFSLLDYRLYYSHSGQPVYMPHTDYIRHVSIAFALLSAALLGASLLSLALARRRPLTASGLAYGASSGLVVLYGLLNGYIGRAVGLDLGRFSHLVGRPNNEVVYRTLAGTITFEGVVIGRTPVYDLVLASPIPLVLLAVAVASSAVAVGMALRSVHATAPTGRPSLRPPGFRKLSAYTTLFLTTFSLLASVFTYYPSSVALAPQPPPATLEPPYAYACTITRTSRAALAYTDFEVYPVPGWRDHGGTWGRVSGVSGAKGYVLQGSDDGRGLGGASQYYYDTDLSARASLWVVAKTLYHAGGKPYYGIILMNAGRTRAFAVALYRFSAVKGYLTIMSYAVAAGGWASHVSTEIPGYYQDNWYTIVIHYMVLGSSINITAHLYDAGGGYVTGTSTTITHVNVFTPAYIGITVDDGTARFDEFVIAASDPRGVLFAGLRTGVSVEVWDDLGLLVASGTALGLSMMLSVVHDVVVGRGTNGRIVVKLLNGVVCADYRVPDADAVLGGDAYWVDIASATLPGVTVELGANKTSARISVVLGASPTEVTFLLVNASRVLYARLLLEGISAPPSLNLDVWLEGVVRSTSITIRGGVPVTYSTSVVQLNIGSGNTVKLSGYFTASGEAALYLRLELCALPDGRGACVSYPLWLALAGYV